MTDQNEDAFTERQLDVAYAALSKSTEFWIVVGRGRIAFRFGPFTGPEAGEHMRIAIEKKIAITVIGQCGREVDWQLAEDLGVRLVDPEPEKETADASP